MTFRSKQQHTFKPVGLNILEAQFLLAMRSCGSNTPTDKILAKLSLAHQDLSNRSQVISHKITLGNQ